MTRIPAAAFRQRLIQNLELSPPLSRKNAPPDYSRLDLMSIPKNEEFVAEAYRRILGREPDLEGMCHFLAALDQGHPRQMVVDGLQRARQASPSSASAEYRPPVTVDLTDLDSIQSGEDFVRESYRRILGREPDREGLRHFLRVLECGGTRQDVIGQLSSARGAAESPPAPGSHEIEEWKELERLESAEEFLSESYQRILGRAADPDGLRHFIGVLNDGVPRRQVLEALARVRDDEPVSAEFAGPPQAVELSVLEELESPDEFVREGYRQTFGREADPAGFAHYRNLLICGIQKAEVLAMLSASPEARGRNRTFLWRGAALPKPIQLGVVPRLRLAFWRITAPVSDRIFHR